MHQHMCADLLRWLLVFIVSASNQQRLQTFFAVLGQVQQHIASCLSLDKISNATYIGTGGEAAAAL